MDGMRCQEVASSAFRGARGGEASGDMSSEGRTNMLACAKAKGQSQLSLLTGFFFFLTDSLIDWIFLILQVWLTADTRNLLVCLCSTGITGMHQPGLSQFLEDQIQAHVLGGKQAPYKVSHLLSLCKCF